VTRAEREIADSVLPDDEATAATWSVAVMELGALVCTAAAPRCGDCPVSDQCAWVAAGRPAYDGPPRRRQAWSGTDRQCRGRLLAAVRESPGPVHHSHLAAAWPDADQRSRCLASLVADGLLESDTLRYTLPGSTAATTPDRYR
jgi:A/G-specific adenine glycosylase